VMICGARVLSYENDSLTNRRAIAEEQLQQARPIFASNGRRLV
jgi:hypothetical protein